MSSVSASASVSATAWVAPAEDELKEFRFEGKIYWRGADNAMYFGEEPTWVGVFDPQTCSIDTSVKEPANGDLVAPKVHPIVQHAANWRQKVRAVMADEGLTYTEAQSALIDERRLLERKKHMIKKQERIYMMEERAKKIEQQKYIRTKRILMKLCEEHNHPFNDFTVSRFLLWKEDRSECIGKLNLYQKAVLWVLAP